LANLIAKLPKREPENDPEAPKGGRPERDLAAFHRLVLDHLDAAIYTTDADGAITYCNAAAVRLWGREPAIGDARWCGSWRLYDADGEPMDHADCPMARAIRERRPIAGEEAVAERPNGERIPFLAYPTPLFDEAGVFVGAANLLVDISGRKSAEAAARQLAAIVESSEDAILTKDLNGVITSWNQGADRLFGYSAEETIGRPVTMLMPPERTDEEPMILDQIRKGQRVEHYETVRRRKDGSLIDISLTVSPLKTRSGRIVGASKIARDITERRRAQSQQTLLLREMSHRIKNLFALASGLVTLSARTAKTAKELTSAVRTRLAALAQAHALTLTSFDEAQGRASVSLRAVIEAILSPYEPARGAAARCEVRGPDAVLTGEALSSFALLLHEFATNAVKYGALSTPEGRILIDCAEDGDSFVIVWRESGGPPVSPPQGEGGFGSHLASLTARGLGGSITYDWRAEGLVIRLTTSRTLLIAPP
jgi:PAS domain S-box-containing protein